uniref:Coiled-coil domain containing 50 n=1 Tax=Varanus komodoensis TaxID=61221 RepID=A0A8D2IRT9_VARKO
MPAKSNNLCVVGQRGALCVGVASAACGGWKSCGRWSEAPGSLCRDFAVLEDHTLAHSLQEQEIEHHLATNVQRNRLVQHDLQVAKRLQEEEERTARARIQEHHKDLERQDCEMAQEIQVRLVIEAEQRRRQEEDDEVDPEAAGGGRCSVWPNNAAAISRTWFREENVPCRFAGTKSRGTKDAVHLVPRAAAAQDQESYDAEIARRLQEEELLSCVFRLTCSVFPSQEIARLLMAEEKKAYRRAKEREKASEKKKQEPDRKVGPAWSESGMAGRNVKGKPSPSPFMFCAGGESSWLRSCGHLRPGVCPRPGQALVCWWHLLARLLQPPVSGGG